MLAPEVSPQVYNLPHSQRNQHAHCSDREPLHSLVRALICVSQLHLSPAQIIQLVNDLFRDLANAAKLGFYGLQLLAGLNRRPVLGIGAYVDVEFYVSRWRGVCAVAGEDILEADVESAVGVRCEGVACFACDVARAGVVVSYSVFDLEDEVSGSVSWCC